MKPRLLLSMLALVIPLAGIAQTPDEAERERQRLAALRADFDRQTQRDAAIAQMQRQQQAQEQQRAQQDILNGLILMQSAQPQPQIRCRSTRFFDTVNTTCN